MQTQAPRCSEELYAISLARIDVQILLMHPQSPFQMQSSGAVVFAHGGLLTVTISEMMLLRVTFDIPTAVQKDEKRKSVTSALM